MANIEDAHWAIAQTRDGLALGRPAMSAGEAELAHHLVAWLEEQTRPGMVSATLSLIGGSPVRAAAQLIPDVLMEPVQRSLAKALVAFSGVAARTAALDAVQASVKEKLGVDIRANPENADVAALEALAKSLLANDVRAGALAGGVGGLAGVMALPAEIPLVVGLALRAAHRTCAVFGVDSSRPPGDALPLHALDLAVGGDSAGAVIRALTLVDAVRRAQEREASPPSDSVSSGFDMAPMHGAAMTAAVGAASVDALAYVEFRRAVERIALRLAARRLAAAVPFVGALVGGVLGYGFLNRVAEAARTLAALALLGRKQGPDQNPAAHGGPAA